MSDEEKKQQPAWWQRAKTVIFVSQFLHSVLTIGGVAIAVYVVIENRIAEILATPKRTKVLEVKDSIQFSKSDSALTKHDGLLKVVFHHVDTNAEHKINYRYTGK